MGFGANSGFDFTKKLKEMLRKKDGVWSKQWICITKEKREFLRKKKGFGTNGGFGCIKKKRELIVEKYKEKRGDLGSMVNLILYTNRTNYEEKRWGSEPTVDLILLRN